MGIYTEYLDRNFDFHTLQAERKNQLARISQIRGRDVLVFAADFSKGVPQTAIVYADLLPINDQLSNLKGKALDLILETPGGSGEAAEDIMRLIRNKYDDVSVIVPGWAKSAGTIMAMAADEILMEPASALGPIDAQMNVRDRVFSAHALLLGFDKIKREVDESGVLSKAYIPMLQGLSIGELENARNAWEFAKRLVTDWLAKYKFKNWETHTSNGQPVTPDEKKQRAEEIANKLRDHSHWLTHARSIKIDDLEGLRLRITDYSKQPDLADAIRRYHTLLQMTFESNIYKVFETPTSQIFRFISPSAPPMAPRGLGQLPSAPAVAEAQGQCGKCNTKWTIQANLGGPSPLREGNHPFPADNKFRCPNCGAEHDLSDLRRQLEMQFKQPVVA